MKLGFDFQLLPGLEEFKI